MRTKPSYDDRGACAATLINFMGAVVFLNAKKCLILLKSQWFKFLKASFALKPICLRLLIEHALFFRRQEVMS